MVEERKFTEEEVAAISGLIEMLYIDGNHDPLTVANAEPYARAFIDAIISKSLQFIEPPHPDNLREQIEERLLGSAFSLSLVIAYCDGWRAHLVSVGAERFLGVIERERRAREALVNDAIAQVVAQQLSSSGVVVVLLDGETVWKSTIGLTETQEDDEDDDDIRARDISDKDRTFRVWLNIGVRGVEATEDTVVIKAGWDADEVCMEVLQVMIDNEVESGWADLEDS